MGKQYTFKTTKSTLWLENVLDSMSSNTRSEFIRSAIISQLVSKQDMKVNTQIFSEDKRSDKDSVNDLGVQKMNKFGASDMCDKWSDFEEEVIEEDIDLDSTLDNITFP